jgi:hypothetical protein
MQPFSFRSSNRSSREKHKEIRRPTALRHFGRAPSSRRRKDQPGIEDEEDLGRGKGKEHEGESEGDEYEDDEEGQRERSTDEVDHEEDETGNNTDETDEFSQSKEDIRNIDLTSNGLDAPRTITPILSSYLCHQT